MRGWIDLCSDVNWIDYHGMWGRKGRDGAWYVVRWTNMHDACGDEAPEKYLCEVLRVDLANMLPEALASSLDCVGATADASEEERVYACVAAGASAPLADFYSNVHAARLRAKARRAAEMYMRDDDERDERLDRIVNAIGSTARDFGRGDSLAGLRRYAASGDRSDPANNLMLKLHGGAV